jgi:hypothetical protein
VIITEFAANAIFKIQTKNGRNGSGWSGNLVKDCGNLKFALCKSKWIMVLLGVHTFYMPEMAIIKDIARDNHWLTVPEVLPELSGFRMPFSRCFFHLDTAILPGWTDGKSGNYPG